MSAHVHGVIKAQILRYKIHIFPLGVYVKRTKQRIGIVAAFQIARNMFVECVKKKKVSI